MQKKDNLVVISLGGSLIVPNEIDWYFIKKFKEIIMKQIAKGMRFIIITGGGKLARRYQESAIKVTKKITNDDRDWLGIHATRMNAHFIRTIFRSDAHPVINKNPNDLDDFYNFKENILIAAGWRPGFSTDYDAVLLGKYFGVKRIINMSNIDYIYDKDPHKFIDAKKINNITWVDFCSMVGKKWDPGMNTPFDPIASKLAQEAKMEVIILNGKKIKNMENCLENKKFKGTVIA